MDHQLEERLALTKERLKRAIKAAHAQDATDEDIAVMLRLIGHLEAAARELGAWEALHPTPTQSIAQEAA